MKAKMTIIAVLALAMGCTKMAHNDGDAPGPLPFLTPSRHIQLILQKAKCKPINLSLPERVERLWRTENGIAFLLAALINLPGLFQPPSQPGKMAITNHQKEEKL